MANTLDAEDSSGGGSAPAGPPGAGGAPPGTPPGGGRPGGGLLAALQRQQQGQQQSAPGPGAQADAMTRLSGAIQMIEAALPSLGAGTPAYKDALKALEHLQKHVVQGSPGAGVQKTMFSDMLQGTVRNALLQKLAAQQGGQQGPPGGPPGGGPPPGGAQAPSPSMPMPGA